MQPTATVPRYEVVDFDALPGVPCPCGTSRRGLADAADFPATIHRVEISADARTHYHRRQTEAYYFLRCEPGAQLQLDDERLPVREGMCVLIRPGVRHRAIGRMTLLNIVWPKFDPADEWFD
jgi:mannose-6-phosphate isomerase-like protein (cupin superfamily)